MTPDTIKNTIKPRFLPMLPRQHAALHFGTAMAVTMEHLAPFRQSTFCKIAGVRLMHLSQLGMIGLPQPKAPKALEMHQQFLSTIRPL